MNINGNKELNIKVLNPNFCCPSWGWGAWAERGCQNRGIGRALFVLFPGVGVGGAFLRALPGSHRLCLSN